MIDDNLKLGQLVKATAGRDEAQYFFIVGFPKTGYILLANGKQRKIAQPKLKKIKHIKKLNIVDEEIHEKLVSSKEITDNLLRKKLASYVSRLA